MSSPSPSSPSADAAQTCPNCRTQASGKFCSNCGGSLAGATCGSCGAPLSIGAKFCHRCGTPAGAEGTSDPRSFSSALPWAVAAIALVALIALIAGQRFSRPPADQPLVSAVDSGAGTGGAAPFAGATGNGAAPDISSMTPAEAAARLYDKVMAAHEQGHADTVALFSPMAIQAYQMIGNLNLDQHYDVGRLAAVSGDEATAKAQSDTILAEHPNHLLGLILAQNAAHMRKDTAAERSYYDKLVAAAPKERATQLPEYIEHENDITVALNSKRP